MGQMVMNQSRAKVKARKAKYKYIFCIKASRGKRAKVGPCLMQVFGHTGKGKSKG
jgi:hypothetical protein